MSSLLYGNWIAGPESENGKVRKRTPTYDKPPKLTNDDFNDRMLDANDLELKLKSTSTSLNEYTNNAEKKQSEIHDLLDQMNKENFETDKMPIQPIAPPQLIAKNNSENLKKLTPYLGLTEGEGIANYQSIYNKGTTYYPDNSSPPIDRGTFPFPQSNGINDQSKVLLEKLNYMIYLLEQQQQEKADYILEEFLLYCFLGVFMIYIVDAFARSGSCSSLRYKR